MERKVNVGGSTCSMPYTPNPAWHSPCLHPPMQTHFIQHDHKPDCDSLFKTHTNLTYFYSSPNPYLSPTYNLEVCRRALMSPNLTFLSSCVKHSYLFSLLNHYSNYSSVCYNNFYNFYNHKRKQLDDNEADAFPYQGTFFHKLPCQGECEIK